MLEPPIVKSLVSSTLHQPKTETTEPPFANKGERIAHFAGRTKWKVVKAKNPDLTPVQHITDTYPDRHRGLLRADLKDERIDPDLYFALNNWLNYRRTDGSRPNKLPKDFGLPTKEEANTALLKREGVPTGSQIYAAMTRGDWATAAELKRRCRAGERRKLRKPAARTNVPSELRRSKAEVTTRTFANKEERIAYFAGRTKWKAAKAKDPDLTPVQHIIDTYPDRNFGLLRADLRDERVDPDLYFALNNWLNYRGPDGSRHNKLPKNFGLPTKADANTALLKREGVPSGTEIFAAMRRGDEDASKELHRRYLAGKRRRAKGLVL